MLLTFLDQTSPATHPDAQLVSIHTFTSDPFNEIDRVSIGIRSLHLSVERVDQHVEPILPGEGVPVEPRCHFRPAVGSGDLKNVGEESRLGGGDRLPMAP